MPRWPRHSCVATGTGALEGRAAWGGGRPRTQAPADRARRTHRDDRASDGRCQGTRDNRSPSPLVAVPRQVSSFRLLTLFCRYGMLFGSDCNNNTLRDVVGVKRGDTVGIMPDIVTRGFVAPRLRRTLDALPDTLAERLERLVSDADRLPTDHLWHALSL